MRIGERVALNESATFSPRWNYHVSYSFQQGARIVGMALCPPDVRKVKYQAKFAINEWICDPGRCFPRPLFKWYSSGLFQAQAGLSTNHDVCADVELSSILAETTQGSRVRVSALAHQPYRHCLHERTKCYLEGVGDDFLPRSLLALSAKRFHSSFQALSEKLSRLCVFEQIKKAV